MRFFAAGLARLSSILNSAALWGAVGALAVMILAASYQVVARYIFHAPPVWTEELARRAMIWSGLLGASVAFYERSDPNLLPSMTEITGGLGKALTLLRLAGVAVFVLPVLYFSLFGTGFNFARGFVARNIGREAEMMGISMAWFTAAVPVTFLLIAIHLAAQLAQSLAGQEQPSKTVAGEEQIPV